MQNYSCHKKNETFFSYSEAGKSYFVTLAKKNVLQNFYNFCCSMTFVSCKIARKSTCGIFNSYSLLYQVTFKSTSLWFNDKNCRFLLHWLESSIKSIFVLTKIFNFFAPFSIRSKCKRINSQRFISGDAYIAYNFWWYLRKMSLLMLQKNLLITELILFLSLQKVSNTDPSLCKQMRKIVIFRFLLEGSFLL